MRHLEPSAKPTTTLPVLRPFFRSGKLWRGLFAIMFAVAAIACAGEPDWPQTVIIEPAGFTYQGKQTPGSPRNLFLDSEKTGAAFVIRRGEGTTSRHFADTLGFKVLVAPGARERLSLGLVDIHGEDVLVPTAEPLWILLEGEEIRVAGFGVSTNALPSAVELGAFLDAVLGDESQVNTPWIVSISAADRDVEAAMRAVLTDKARSTVTEVPWTE